MNQNLLWRVLVSCGVASCLGVAAVVLAAYGNPDVNRCGEAPLFPLICRGVEGMNGGSFLFLALAGLVATALGRTHPLLVGLATMTLFPVASLAEMVVDPTSHNLWPFEWTMYAIATLPGILGAFLGRWFRRALWDTAGPSDEDVR